MVEQSEVTTITPESGTPESGTPESGTPDSGTPESGSRDGGTTSPVGERSWALVGGWAGIGFVLLGLLATFAYPQPPRIDSPPRVILSWAHGHRTGIYLGMLMGVFASLLFLWFVACLRRRLDSTGNEFLGSVVYGSGIAYAVFVALGSLPAATLVFMDGQPGGLTTGSVVRLLLDLYQVLYAPATALIGVLFVALGLASLTTSVFPRWLGWLAIVMGGLCVIETVPILINSSYHPGGWQVVGWIAAVGSLLVIIPVCVVILRSAGEARPARTR